MQQVSGQWVPFSLSLLGRKSKLSMEKKTSLRSLSMTFTIYFNLPLYTAGCHRSHQLPQNCETGWFNAQTQCKFWSASQIGETWDCGLFKGGVCVLNVVLALTWKRAEESNLKPSDPGCLTRGKAPGSSTAKKALKATFPNVRAWVSGWALSWGEKKEYLGLNRHKAHGTS